MGIGNSKTICPEPWACGPQSRTPARGAAWQGAGHSPGLCRGTDGSARPASGSQRPSLVNSSRTPSVPPALCGFCAPGVGEGSHLNQVSVETQMSSQSRRVLGQKRLGSGGSGSSHCLVLPYTSCFPLPSCRRPGEQGRPELSGGPLLEGLSNPHSAHTQPPRARGAQAKVCFSSLHALLGTVHTHAHQSQGN